MDLHALADFILVASHGGFGRASRVTGRPKATLSRHVADLETGLGVRLVDRGTRVLRLTDEGRQLYESTSGLLAEVAEAGEAVSSGAPVPRGRLRVSAPVVFAHVVLGRLAARFALAHPLVRLEIVADDRPVNLIEERFDVVIRINPSPDEHLAGRRVMGDRLLLVAARDLPRPAGDGRGERVVRAVTLSSTRDGIAWRVRNEKNAVVAYRIDVALRLSTLLMVRDAAVAGAGAALLPELLVADDIRAGRLVCWGIDDRPPVEIWALQPARRLISAKVKAFLDALTQAYPDKVYRSAG